MGGAAGPRAPATSVFGPYGRRGVSEVLGTFLMLAVTLVLVVVLFLMISGPATPPPETSQLVFEVQPYTQNATNASRNDTFFTIQAKLGNGEVFWNDSSLQLYILDNNGSLLSGHNQTFLDLNQNGKADGGDRVVIRGMTAAYHQLRLRINYHQRIIADIALP
jgi:flagellin-like protein